MSYVALTVALQLGRSNAALFSVANDLAKRMNVAVTAIARAQPIVVLMGDNFFAAEIIQADDEAIAAEAKAAEAEFRMMISESPTGLNWDMAVTSAPLSDSIADAAMTGDLLVAGLDRKEDETSRITRRVDIANLIQMAGRPVLVVPPGIEHFGFGCALVAWKGSREARRAVADALPMLRLMQKVVVVEVADAADQGAALGELDKLLTWLGGHGVSAVSRVELAGGDDGGRLLELAEEERAELIVAGAYGHNRYREWVLGGVTRTLLNKGPCCLLLSH